MTGTYGPPLVALSVLVAAFAFYTALDLGGRLKAARGLARRVWLITAAVHGWLPDELPAPVLIQIAWIIYLMHSTVRMPDGMGMGLRIFRINSQGPRRAAVGEAKSLRRRDFSIRSALTESDGGKCRIPVNCSRSCLL